jgi:hypothetical protein
MSRTRRARYRESVGPMPFLAVLLVVLTAIGAGAVLAIG